MIRRVLLPNGEGVDVLEVAYDPSRGSWLALVRNDSRSAMRVVSLDGAVELDCSDSNWKGDNQP